MIDLMSRVGARLFNLLVLAGIVLVGIESVPLLWRETKPSTAVVVACALVLWFLRVCENLVLGRWTIAVVSIPAAPGSGR